MPVTSAVRAEPARCRLDSTLDDQRPPRRLPPAIAVAFIDAFGLREQRLPGQAHAAALVDFEQLDLHDVALLDDVLGLLGPTRTAVSEMCSSPSTPGMISMNAPNAVVLLTVPS